MHTKLSNASNSMNTFEFQLILHWGVFCQTNVIIWFLRLFAIHTRSQFANKTQKLLNENVLGRSVAYLYHLLHDQQVSKYIFFFYENTIYI